VHPFLRGGMEVQYDIDRQQAPEGVLRGRAVRGELKNVMRHTNTRMKSNAWHDNFVAKIRRKK
jgi:hypothetical protein